PHAGAKPRSPSKVVCDQSNRRRQCYQTPSISNLSEDTRRAKQFIATSKEFAKKLAFDLLNTATHAPHRHRPVLPRSVWYFSAVETLNSCSPGNPADVPANRP